MKHTCPIQKPGHTMERPADSRAESGQTRWQQNWSPRKQWTLAFSSALKTHQLNAFPEARTKEILLKPKGGTKPRTEIRCIGAISTGWEAIFRPVFWSVDRRLCVSVHLFVQGRKKWTQTCARREKMLAEGALFTDSDFITLLRKTTWQIQDCGWKKGLWTEGCRKVHDRKQKAFCLERSWQPTKGQKWTRKSEKRMQKNGRKKIVSLRDGVSKQRQLETPMIERERGSEEVRRIRNEARKEPYCEHLEGRKKYRE